jgi:hypothetical protein
LHSAQRQTARVEIPSHLATAAVVRSGSRFTNSFSMHLFRTVCLEDVFCGGRDTPDFCRDPAVLARNHRRWYATTTAYRF